MKYLLIFSLLLSQPAWPFTEVELLLSPANREITMIERLTRSSFIEIEHGITLHMLSRMDELSPLLRSRFLELAEIQQARELIPVSILPDRTEQDGLLVPMRGVRLLLNGLIFGSFFWQNLVETSCAKELFVMKSNFLQLYTLRHPQNSEEFQEVLRQAQAFLQHCQQDPSGTREAYERLIGR